MSGMLNKRARNITPSHTMAIDSRAKQMLAQGVDVINLSVGEPDFDTPDHAKEGGLRAIREGFTKYTPSAGIAELRQAIADKLRRDNALEYSPDEIVVTNGCKGALFNIFMVLLDAGDEAIIQSPYWVSYPEMVKLAGGTPVIVPTDESTGWQMTPEMLERAITPRTKLLNLNNPCNPTGAVYDAQRLRALADVALKHGLLIVSDEIYDELTYDGAEAVSVAALSAEIKERTITVNGFSKTFAMTGWRLGYAAAPRAIAKALADLQSHSTSGASSITQKAGLAALAGDPESLRAVRAEFDRRRRYAIERVRALPGFELAVEPRGAFYVFPRVTALYGRSIGAQAVRGDDDLCAAILEAAHVAIVPGSSFGAPGYVRISYATSMEKLTAAFDRIARLLEVRSPAFA